MDSYKAKQLETILINKDFLAYKITKLLNNGKSAAVFSGTDKIGNLLAIKIFDNELIERFGHDIQQKRIEQEISLKGHKIPNLIKIIDGGKTQIDGNEYYYIIMEYIEGENLKQYIESNIYDDSLIKKIGLTLFNITEELLKKGIVHRDIKPENIMINTCDDVILMDLGVLKLIGVPSLSDIDEKQFVGTLRYAPPEFLTRTEEDTNDGWKSVNLYQIGGVLHDLITKKELFGNYTPYSNLVIAIKEDAPVVSSEEYSFETVQLTRDLLTKDYFTRLRLCSDKRIVEWAKKKDIDNDNIERELEEIYKMTSAHKAKFELIEGLKRSNEDKKIIRQNISNDLEKVIINIFDELREKGLYTKFQKSNSFYFESDRELKSSNAVKNILFQLQGDLNLGFPKPLFVLVKIHNDEKSLTSISLLNMFLSSFIKINLTSPLEMFKQIVNEKQPRQNVKNVLMPNNQTVYLNLKLFKAFEGTVGFDEQFYNMIKLQIVKLINKSLKAVEEKVKLEFESREKYAKGEVGMFVTSNLKTIFVDEIDS